MNKLEMISNILDDFFKNNNTKVLEEKQAGMSVDLINEKQIFLSFSMDRTLSEKDFPKGLFPFFNRGLPGVCLFCDYSTLFVLLIELKKGKDNVTKQLEAGKCFVEFIISTVNRVYKQDISPEIRKISIREYKKKPKQKQKSIKYDENNFHTFDDSKFFLKKYLV